MVAAEIDELLFQTGGWLLIGPDNRRVRRVFSCTRGLSMIVEDPSVSAAARLLRAGVMADDNDLENWRADRVAKRLLPGPRGMACGPGRSRHIPAEVEALSRL